MISYFNILTIMHKETIEKFKKEQERKTLKRFLKVHFFIFFLSFVFVLLTGYFGFISIIFIPYVYIFSPKGGFVQKASVVVNYKEFYISILFSCIFTVLLFILMN